MDARELKERLDALQKAINEKDPPATVLSMLETLKTNVVATEDLLRVMLSVCQISHPAQHTS